MTKTLTYTSFIIAAILVILAFITAKSYTQLAIAVILYPALAYFAFRLFPRKGYKAFTIQVPIQVQRVKRQEVSKRELVDVADIDKRTFLKLIGAAGLSFFLFSLLGKRVETLLFGRSLTSNLTDTAESEIPSATSATKPTEGYNITEIDEDVITFYGFTNKAGGWLIMREDTETSSFRYAKGTSNFPASWANRKKLKYDYFYNLY